MTPHTLCWSVIIEGTLSFYLQAVWRNLTFSAHTDPVEMNMQTTVTMVDSAYSPNTVTNLPACKKCYLSHTHTRLSLTCRFPVYPEYVLVKHCFISTCTCWFVFTFGMHSQISLYGLQLHVLIQRGTLPLHQWSHSQSGWNRAAHRHRFWGTHAHLCPGHHHLLLCLQEVSICNAVLLVERNI